jgi:ATP synthase protein I
MSDEWSGGAGRRPPRIPPGRGGALSGAEFAGIGVQFAAVILAFVFAGVWLDKRLGSSPWFVISFVFIGAAAGFYSIYRKVMSAQRRGGGQGGGGGGGNTGGDGGRGMGAR